MEVTVIWILLVLGAGLAVFSAYTKNMQSTTLNVGRKLLPDVPLLPTGLQDAISPPAQTRNNFLIIAGWVAYGALCFWGLSFYIAILVLLGTFFIGVTAASHLGLVPKPMSKRFVAKIRQNMEFRLALYRQTGNYARMAAAEEVLRRFEAVMRG